MSVYDIKHIDQLQNWISSAMFNRLVCIETCLNIALQKNPFPQILKQSIPVQVEEPTSTAEVRIILRIHYAVPKTETKTET